MSGRFANRKLYPCEASAPLRFLMGTATRFIRPRSAIAAETPKAREAVPPHAIVLKTRDGPERQAGRGAPKFTRPILDQAPLLGCPCVQDGPVATPS